MDGDLPALDPVEVRGPVRTARLVLRPFTPDDVVAIESYAESPGARPHLAGSAADPARMLADRLDWTRLAGVGDRLALAIELPAQGQRWARVVGEVHLLLRDPGARQAELGVVLHEDVRGAGLAAEAADRILELAFAEAGVHRVACRFDAADATALGLAERLGMRREALLVHDRWAGGAWADTVVVALLDVEWAARKSLDGL
ncbi:GNAT family N-acetyltransferase [Clavibacter nebraskensis]|uniref:N-acetyltransferase n=2 Tax=Clavibacter nebraskensis TaxID=31963 RepID=A0A399Q2J8_9MICO|nr:GNAT family protein [Clavibacter nebraskensis]KXU21745.1 acetyltransferase [Clavibacter nebraskensis]OAH22603.1 acetyltransferase [Clavibacter nebraskensis]QGV68013.1 GNAT family N-acetyltransferase [Clavibacter nebraskensis]QGV70812.1 GNAT family N-acetyltransferase [Clavibacter nebraskensis]QGV73604.1 GNAT family N-acetyltransferase [Clavibacter nebraskensis]